MAEHFDVASAKQRYELLDDTALIRIAYDSTAGYTPEAVDLARTELSSRGISGSDPAVISARETEKSAPLDEKNNPLHGALKALCFILTPVPALVIATWQFASGRNRAGKDALAWMFYGLVTWFLLGAVLRSI